LVEQRQWLAPGKPLPALILLIGIVVAPISIPYALSRIEFQYFNNVGVRTYPNLPGGLLMSIPGIILVVFGFLLFYGKINPYSRGLVARYSMLLVIFACLGILPLIVYLEFYSLSPVTFWLVAPLWLASPLGLFCTSHVINGLAGLYVSKKDLTVKHSKLFYSLFGSIAILGAIFVTLAYVFLYWSITGSEMLHLLPSTPLIVAFLFFGLLGGPVFLTVGILGIGRQYLKKNQSLFTLLALLTIIVIPLCIFALFCYTWVSVGLEPAF
jgi:hypothetical protein